MITFQQYLSENYKNLIGPESHQQREKWVDQVWQILQRTYEPIGGIKGSGFSSKQDLINNIPFWKLYVKNDRVLAAFFYKDKGGRKAVAVATDGSEAGRRIVVDQYKSGLKVSFGEKSGRALATVVKNVEWGVLRPFLLEPSQIKQVTGDDVVPVNRYGIKKLNAEDRLTYDRFPQLRPFMYVREIGGEDHLKVMMGTPGIKITPNRR